MWLKRSIKELLKYYLNSDCAGSRKKRDTFSLADVKTEKLGLTDRTLRKPPRISLSPACTKMYYIHL